MRAWIPGLLLLVACGGTGEALSIEYSEDAQPTELGWSRTGGELSVTHDHAFPRLLWLRLEGVDLTQDNDAPSPIASATVDVVEGNCALSQPAACDHGACLIQLEILGVGHCVIAAHARTVRGHTVSSCMFWSELDGDPDDAAAQDQGAHETDAADARCKRSL